MIEKIQHSNSFLCRAGTKKERKLKLTAIITASQRKEAHLSSVSLFIVSCHALNIIPTERGNSPTLAVFPPRRTARVVTPSNFLALGSTRCLQINKCASLKTPNINAVSHKFFCRVVKRPFVDIFKKAYNFS